MSNIYKDYKVPTGNGGLYHKFEDGVTYTVRIASEPIVYQTQFGEGETATLSTKYAWVIWNVDEAQAQIMQLPSTGYSQIAAFAADDEYGDPTEYNLRITRTGKGLETKYAVIASPKRSKLEEVHEDAVRETGAIDLIDSISKGKGVSNVNWLRDVIDGPASSRTDLKDTQKFNDAVQGVMGGDKLPVDSDKKVNLEDIPS